MFDGHIGQVADDAIYIFAHVAHFGELGRFNLDEGRVGQLGQAACNLGFAHARGANHEDVFRRDFVTQVTLDLASAPAVAQGNGDGTFGSVLADDVVVQFTDDFLGG